MQGRYRTGAETVRWTLDLNNDGVVDGKDQASDDGADARRTANPNDYEMVREVWGDSTNGAAGNNGGKRERVAMIKQPGGATPPLFTQRCCLETSARNRNTASLTTGSRCASRGLRWAPRSRGSWQQRGEQSGQ